VKNKSHQYIQGLLGVFSRKGLSTQDLKNESPDVISYVLKRAAQYPNTSRKVFGNPFPSSLSEFLPNLSTKDAKNLLDELTWTAISLCHWQAEINSFLLQKKIFEHHIINGKLDEAHQHLMGIMEQFKSSLWATESAILLAERSSGIKFNREVLERAVSETNDFLAKMLFQYSSQRAEQDLSIAAYNDAIHENLCEWMNDEELYTNVAYLLFKGTYLSFRKYSERNLLQVLNYESCYSIVDRYLLFIKILEYLAVVDLDTNRSVIQNAIDSIGSGFNDQRVQMLKTACDGDLGTFDVALQSQVNQVLDSYTVGEYSKACDESSSLLEQFPMQLEFYEVYAKSLIHLGQTPLNTNNENSISSQIIEDMYNVCARTPSADDCILRLEKIAYTFWNTTLGPQLVAFVGRHQSTEIKYNFNLLREVNSSVYTPRFIRVFQNSKDSSNYIESFNSKCENNITLQLLQASDESNTELMRVPVARRLACIGSSKLRGRDYYTSISIFQELKSQIQGNPLFECHTIEGLFKAYLETGKLNDCLGLILDVYFRRREFLLSISIRELLNRYEELDGPGYSADYGWAVLHSIYYTENLIPTDNKKLFILHDSFLLSAGVSRPSVMSLKCGNLSRLKII